MEFNYKDTCRICLTETDQMSELFSLTLPSHEILVVDFIRKVTGLKLLEADELPTNICPNCTRAVHTSFDFVELCVKSDNILRNQETRRILRKIEEEALRDDLVEKYDEVALEENLEENTTTDLIDEEIENDELHISTYSDTPANFFLTDKYKCDICPLSFSNKSKFQTHQKVHNTSNPFKCSECTQTFTKKLHLSVHLRSHVKDTDKHFSCKTCGQLFIFEYLLKQHEYKHVDVKPFPCSKCSKGCLTSESLRRHMKTHEETYIKKTHTCKICDKEFPYPSFLDEHMKNHTGEKPYLCSICGKGFRQKGALHYHQRIHTGFKPFTCVVCDENFMSQSVLKVHMRKHTNERPFICDLCGRSFRQSTDLKSHKRTHTGEKPILCPICGKKMATSGQLTVHIRSHTGEKPYSCPECGRGFATKTMLTKHQRIHSGERPYVCDVCGKAFSQSSTLRTHGKIHDNVVNVKKPKSKIVRIKAIKNIGGSVQEKELYKLEGDLEQNDVDSTTEITVILPAPIPMLQNT